MIIDLITRDEIEKIQNFRDEERQKFNEGYMKLISQFARFSDALTKQDELKKLNEFEILFYYDRPFME